MSQQVQVTVTCPKCGKQYQEKLFRTVWGEHESMRNAVMNDNINICKCPHCGYSFHAPMAMMYVDVQKRFAVWWEPEYDSNIEETTAAFAKMLGAGNFYETAPRITDWDEFKDTIKKYYSGELKGQSDEVTRRQDAVFSAMAKNFSTNSHKKNNSGCMVVALAVFALIGGFIILM